MSLLITLIGIQYNCDRVRVKVRVPYFSRIISLEECTQTRVSGHKSVISVGKSLSALISVSKKTKPEKPVTGLIIGGFILRHVNLARPLGAPAALVMLIPEARTWNIAGNL